MALVMAQDDFGRRLQRFDAVENPVADPRVLAFRATRASVNSPGFEKDTVGNPNLADIM